MNGGYPFTAIVGQEAMRMALVLNAIAPEIGGVLIQGDRGTAKSTAVRGLAALLPEIEVAENCPYGCDPDEPAPYCPVCANPMPRRRIHRRAPLVELPLGAGEDRVLGHLDLEAALGEGRQQFRPGLLAAAHRGILYVDEVNLLPDHLVDVLLDVAASGRHTLERDGFSLTHPARFVLVGTMNPEEGELRPQLVDRFGLGVAVTAAADVEQRAEIIMRRIAYEKNPVEFIKQWSHEEQALRERIRAARSRLPGVQLSQEMLQHLVKLCAQSGVVGMRADIVAHRAARARAAYHGRSAVLAEDVEEAVALALFHRGGQLPPQPPAPPARRQGRSETAESAPQERGAHPQPATTLQFEGTDVSLEGGRALPDQWQGVADGRLRRRLQWRGAGGGALSGKHRRNRHGVRGRTVAASQESPAPGLHVPATLHAALIRRLRTKGSLLPMAPDDLRRPVREAHGRILYVFLVDASGSMGAARRMAWTKTAVLALAGQARVQRDRVALMTFRGAGASLVVPPTQSVPMVERCLDRIATGGRTPLAEGLREAWRFMLDQRRRAPEYEPVLVVFTDGRGNVRWGEATPLEAAQRIGAQMAREGVRAVVVDTEDGYVRLRLAEALAGALKAQLVPLAALVTAGERGGASA